MSQNAVKIDNVYYDVKIPAGGIKRRFKVLDGDDATRVANGEMHRSIIGTYYNYTINFDCSALNPSAYDSLYEVLSAPENYHAIIVPYGQTTLSFLAYVTEGEDELEEIEDGENHWQGLSVQFIAMKPART